LVHLSRSVHLLTVERLFLRLLLALAATAGVVLALIAILIPVNLVLRACCGGSIRGLFDAIEYALMAATFLAAPWVLAQNAHVTVDIVTLSLPEPVRRHLAHAINALGIVLSALLAWYALSAAAISLERGSMIRTAFAMPEWLTLVAPGVCGVLLMLEFARRLWRGQGKERSTAGL
jgi:TRAP-type transport system small permease protein